MSSTGYHHNQYGSYGRSPIGTSRNRMFGHHLPGVLNEDQRMTRFYEMSQGGRLVPPREKDGKLDDSSSKYDMCSRKSQYIMHSDDVKAGKKSSWWAIEIKGGVKNLSPGLWQFTHLTALHMRENALNRLPPEISRLTQLIHLDVSSNKLRSIPEELGDLVQLKELLLNNNLIRNLPYELGRLFQLTNLGLKGNPLSQEILTLYSDQHGTQRLLTYLLDNLPSSESGGPGRHWMIKNEKDSHPNKTPHSEISVMCYNVLCDKMATRNMYGYCPTWALCWDYRKKGILEEIRVHGADIVTLQEVETEQYFNTFKPELKADDWEGIFSPKSRAKSMRETERKGVDGCAIFYKASKYTFVEQHVIEFNQLALANAEGSDDMLNRVMTKDNISLAVLLKTNSKPEQYILVCTAHIHWNPEYCDVKLIQTMMLMRELQTIHEKSKKSTNSSNIPVILTGDLNSLPNSGVIEFLRNGRIANDHPDFKDLDSYRTSLRKLTAETSGSFYNHGFQLGQAYAENDVPYTNYTYDFQGMIDYIFYSKDDFSTNAILGPVDTDWLAQHKVIGFPHQDIPSDHIPLVAQLQLYK